MDFANAFLLALLVFVILEGIKRIWPTLSDKIKVPLAFAIAIGVVFLVAAAKAFGHTQVVDGHALDTMDASSKVIVGIVVGGLSVGIDVGQKAIKNIGQNHP